MDEEKKLIQLPPNSQSPGTDPGPLKFKLPRAINESTIELFGIKVRVYTLNDGRRVVHADDTAKLLEQMNERHIKFNE